MATSFSEELREAAGDQWERVIYHKFTIELAKGEIDRDGECLIILVFLYVIRYAHQHYTSYISSCTFTHMGLRYTYCFYLILISMYDKCVHKVLKKYLIQDHRFLDAFVILLSSTIAKCRTLEDRIPGCQFLGLITGKENTYFERSFEVLGCSNVEERMKVPDEEVTMNFVNLMKESATEGTLG